MSSTVIGIRMKMRIHILAENSSVMEILIHYLDSFPLLAKKASLFLPGTCIGGKLSPLLIIVSGKILFSR